MKKITLIMSIMILLFSIGALSEDKEEVKFSEATTNVYDSVLAEKLGADEYGMKSYVIAFLKPGPNRDQDSATAVELQKAHRANIRRLAQEGKLVLAGPFLDGGEMAGLFIFNVTTIEEAKQLTESDPAIKAGRLIMDLHPWYGSAALVQVNDVHQTIKK
jgi:uncharacterized protein YciI